MTQDKQPPTNEERSRTVLITGATDGIGLALAKRLQTRGDRLVLVGRRPVMPFDIPLLQDALYCQADLTETDATEKVAAFLQRAGIDALDMLIHNAGAGYFGALEDCDPTIVDKLLRLNLFAPLGLTQKLLPLLKCTNGHVCFVSSVVSTLPAARYAVYAASKAALEGFARSLRVELAGHVTVQIVRPGATRTGMHQKMGVSLKDMPWDRFPDAGETAEHFEKALAHGRDCSFGWGNTVAWAAGRYFPTLLDRIRLRRQTDRAAGSLVNAPQSVKRCLITGAAQGIGLAFARALACADWQVVGIDVDTEALEAGVESVTQRGRAMTGLCIDLSDPLSYGPIAEDIAAHGPYDLVLHCAGISAVGHFGALPLSAQEAVLAVNFRGPVQLTMLLLQCGGYGPHSQTICVASLSCFTSYPGACAYAASKDGLASFARGLRLTLGPTHRVSVLYPGPVNTSHAMRYSPNNGQADRRMAPERVTDTTLRAIQRRKWNIVPGGANRMAAFMGHWAPWLTERAMRSVIYDKLEDSIRIHEPLPSVNKTKEAPDHRASNQDKEYDLP